MVTKRMNIVRLPRADRWDHDRDFHMSNSEGIAPSTSLERTSASVP